MNLTMALPATRGETAKVTGEVLRRVYMLLIKMRTTLRARRVPEEEELRERRKPRALHLCDYYF